MKKETNKTKSHTAKHHKPRKKVFDVVPPGKAPASATSRPVITGHKPPVADDQFVPGAPLLRAADPSERHELLDSKEKKRLEPAAVNAGNAGQDTDTVPPPPVVQPQNDKPAPVTISAPVLSAESTEVAPSAEVPSPPVISAKDAAMPQPMSGNQDRTEEERLEEERTAGHLAVEQFVEADGLDAPAAFESSSPPSKPAAPVIASSQQLPASNNTDVQPKTIDDLLAETGAPSLEPATAPTGIIISHHTARGSAWEPVLIFLLVIVLAAVILNFLLDAEIIETTLSLPHTDVL